MAKSVYTDKGNIKLVMNQLQYAIVMALLERVKLGDSNRYETEISDLVIDLSEENEVRRDFENLIIDISKKLEIGFESDDADKKYFHIVIVNEGN